ncbi:MAG TPA: hypothetical protein PKW75_08310 [candidate division Zixibacteria bacterium]|nr:hypothetical protein [candidate division Zixibacteria bacterium]HPM36449.1 hypothetical protein [candidate division Zixibacteria bacterium]
MCASRRNSGQLAAGVLVPPPSALSTGGQIDRQLRLSTSDLQRGRYRILLYRFLADSIPAVAACVGTWVRLAAAPGRFLVDGDVSPSVRRQVEERLERLSAHVYRSVGGTRAGGADLPVDIAAGLFRDGFFGGFVTVDATGTGVDRFIPVDAARVNLTVEDGRRQFRYAADHGDLDLDRPDFYYIPLSGGVNAPLGRSVLQAVPFVAYIEQQLVDDMRRSSHNAGFHRLHVKVTPPERLAGESDTAYVQRINGYFDETVGMIRSCAIDENPVTWDNVAIDYIGPDATRSVTNSWFFSHRSMIEEICAGTGLAPFLLGYSYGATTSWSGFKFDLVMRQVRSVQAEMSRLIEWIAAIDLALAGFSARVRWEFDNTFAYQAGERAGVESTRINDLIRLYEVGLIDRATAAAKAAGLV